MQNLSNIFWFVGDGWKKPVGVLFIDALWEEGDNSKKLSGVGAEFSEHRRSE